MLRRRKFVEAARPIVVPADLGVLEGHFGPPHEEVKGSLRRFAEYVMPHLAVPSNVAASRH